jgi:PAS domain S-box-containing protein
MMVGSLTRRPQAGVLNVLLVEDNAADARLVTEFLHEAPKRFAVTHTPLLRDACEFLAAGDFNAVVLDLGLPDSQGLDTLHRTRAAAGGTPVIVLTGLDDEALAIDAVVNGAQDYLVKGASTGQLLRHSVMYAIERAKVESTMRERDERFRQLADNMREVFFVVDAQFRATLYVSPGYEIVWGVPCSTLYDRPGSFIESVMPEDVSVVMENIARVQGGEDPGEIEFRIVRPDGERRWLLTHAMPVRDASGAVYRIAGVAMDVTDRRSLERQYQQAQKMEAVGRLAGGVAHDFNNLLTVISSYTSLILTENTLAEPIRDDLRQIAKAADSAATLTRQLLAFSRQQIVQPKVLSLNDVTRDAEKMLRRVIGEDIALVTTFGSGLGHVMADFGQLEQVIMNLAVNARDAMPGGGQLSIETANVALTHPFSRDGFAAEPGDYIAMVVRDTGTGMNDETKQRIFEPFFTTKESGKGTGLGLAMVFGIVKQSGGYIAVDSEPGEGSSFALHWPRVESALDAKDVAAAGAATRGTETVLLVEDVSALREIMRRVLVENGYAVLDAPDARSALLQSEKYRGTIHLLLSDVVLPGISGPELSERLKGSRPEMKVLFTSGYAGETAARQELSNSGAAFMQKPFTPDTLNRRVREVLD